MKYMSKTNFYNFLFEEKMNEGLFSMQDEELKEQEKKAKKSQKALMEYIEKFIDEDKKKQVLELLEERDAEYNDVFYLQGRLYYKYGIKDGISIIISSISED
jgi:glutamate synthase domain-containing protein 3